MVDLSIANCNKLPEGPLASPGHKKPEKHRPKLDAMGDHPGKG